MQLTNELEREENIYKMFSRIFETVMCLLSITQKIDNWIQKNSLQASGVSQLVRVKCNNRSFLSRGKFLACRINSMMLGAHIHLFKCIATFAWLKLFYGVI